jgi:hypothetical protein
LLSLKHLTQYKTFLRRKKNYGNSNISPCKNIIFKKSSTRNQNPSKDYNSQLLISSFNTSQKMPSFKNPHIKINLLPPSSQNPLSYYTL